MNPIILSPGSSIHSRAAGMTKKGRREAVKQARRHMKQTQDDYLAAHVNEMKYSKHLKEVEARDASPVKDPEERREHAGNAAQEEKELKLPDIHKGPAGQLLHIERAGDRIRQTPPSYLPRRKVKLATSTRKRRSPRRPPGTKSKELEIYIEPNKVCQKCTVSIPDDANFCHKCGHKVGEEVEGEKTAADQDDLEQSNQENREAPQEIEKYAGYSPAYFRLNEEKHPIVLHKAGLICPQCTLSIERDAEFWGRKYDKGGEIMLQFVLEHMSMYPRFLVSLVEKIMPQVLELISQSELLYSALLDSRGDLERTPEKLLEELLALDSEALGGLLAQLLDKSPSALMGLLSSEEWMLKELLRLADKAALSKLLMEPVHNEMIMGALSKGGQEEALTRMLDLSTPKTKTRVLSRPVHKHLLVKAVGADSKNLRDLLTAASDELLASLLGSKESLLEEMLKRLKPSTLTKLLVEGNHEQSVIDYAAQDGDVLFKILERAERYHTTDWEGLTRNVSFVRRGAEADKEKQELERLMHSKRNKEKRRTELKRLLSFKKPWNRVIEDDDDDEMVHTFSSGDLLSLNYGSGELVDGKQFEGPYELLARILDEHSEAAIKYLQQNRLDLLSELLQNNAVGALSSLMDGRGGGRGGKVGENCLLQLCEQTNQAPHVESEGIGSPRGRRGKGGNKGQASSGGGPNKGNLLQGSATKGSLLNDDGGGGSSDEGDEGDKSDEGGKAGKAGKGKKGDGKDVEMDRSNPGVDAMLRAMQAVSDSDAHSEQFWEAFTVFVKKNAGKVEQKMKTRPELSEVVATVCANCKGCTCKKAGKGKKGGEKKNSDANVDVGMKRHRSTWDKLLGGKYKTAEQVVDVKQLITRVWEIYESKCRRKDGDDIPLQEFVRDFMLVQFGAKKTVANKLRLLIKSLRAHADKDPFVQTFAEFVGVAENGVTRDNAQAATYCWAVKKLLDNQKKLHFAACSAHLNSKISRAGGEATVAIMYLKPAMDMLASMLSSFDIDVDKCLAELDAHAWEMAPTEAQHIREVQYVSVGLFLHVFLDASDRHRSVEREKLTELFKRTDTDGSGLVDYDEFKVLVASLPAFSHLSDFQCTRMYYQATGDSEEIDLESFIHMAQGEMKAALTANLMDEIAESLTNQSASYQQMMADYVLKMFKKFDAEGTGSIPTAKFPFLMKEAGFDMSEREAAAVVRIIDKDNDGTIDPGEFLDWWREYAMHQVFLKFDADGSGELSKEEVTNVLSHLGIRYDGEEQFDSIFREIDVDNNGLVSFAELLQWFSVFDARTIFQKYDEDGSGALGLDELKSVLADLGMQVTPELLDHAMGALDADGNGEVSFSEFVPWWTSHQRKMKKESLTRAREGQPSGSQVLNRRGSEQLALSTTDDAYLKMGAQRAVVEAEAQRHLQGVLTAVAEDHGFNTEKFLRKYCVRQSKGLEAGLLRRKPSAGIGAGAGMGAPTPRATPRKTSADVPAPRANPRKTPAGRSFPKSPRKASAGAGRKASDDKTQNQQASKKSKRNSQ